MASAMCLGSRFGTSSRSATVRATFRMRSWARALRPCWVIARSSRRSQSAESSQKVRMWREDIWALQIELFTGRSESFQLFLASADHPVADFGRTFRLVGRTHFFVVHGGDIDVNVDAIHERTGNLGDVALDHRRGAL